MPDVGLAPVANGAASRFVNRRTLLVGAAGALAAAGLSGPARAAGSATSLAARRFDPDLARRLRLALHAALRDPSTQSPGAILGVQSAKLGRWSGAAGLGRVAPAEPMRSGDRFRAGSIVKMFVSVTVLQLTERGRLSLDAPLPEVLPPSVTGSVANAADITMRMLLGTATTGARSSTRTSAGRRTTRSCSRSARRRPTPRCSPGGHHDARDPRPHGRPAGHVGETRRVAAIRHLRAEAREIAEIARAKRLPYGSDVHHRVPLEFAHLQAHLDPNRLDNLIVIADCAAREASAQSCHGRGHEI